MRAVPVEPTRAPPPGPIFVDGIQRYAVVGHIGIAPIVRGVVAAAALARGHRDTLQAEAHLEEEFVVAPLTRLPAAAVNELRATDLPLYESRPGERAHPILDVRAAAQVVENRRERVEREVLQRVVRHDADRWIVVDGSVSTYAELGGSRLVGLIKSHETQFLEGSDLDTVLTLPEGARSSVFARAGDGQSRVFSWYLRLWPREGHDLLYGLIRLERHPADVVVEEADFVSGWILTERAPLAGRDGRWDRLIYPVHQVEAFLRARAGSWM